MCIDPIVPMRFTSRKEKLLAYFADKHICKDPTFIDECSDTPKNYELDILAELYEKEIRADYELLYHLSKMYDREYLIHEILNRPGDGSLIQNGSFDFWYDLDSEKFRCYVSSQNENGFLKTMILTTPVILPGERILLNLTAVPACATHEVHISCVPNYASLIVKFVNEYRLWSDNFRRIFDSWMSRKISDEVYVYM